MIPKERPILFSTPMVQAILEDRKTMTRRIVKCKSADINGFNGDWENDKNRWCYVSAHGNSDWFECPYGMIGDRLWVRETFCEADDRNAKIRMPILYRADAGTRGNKWWVNKNLNWKPSIFMPRSASRITLEITKVRVERLQEITEQDALREGIDDSGDAYTIAEHYQLGGSPIQGGYPAIYSFIELWQSINGPESWEANPWVWVIEFRRIK